MREPAEGAKPGVVTRAHGRVRALRGRSPLLDHAVRAYDRYTEVLGKQLAGAVTYFGFLSFFPLLALVFSAVGYLSAYYPDAQRVVTDAVEEAFPGLIGTGEGQIDIQDVIDAKAGAGIIGLLGLLYAGLGWLDALRDGFRRVYGTTAYRIGFVRRKTIDVFVLVALGVSLLASLMVTSLATEATTQALDLAGLSGSGIAVLLLKGLSVCLALAADTLIFAIVLSRLGGAGLPWRQVRSGAFLAAIGFEVLKVVGTFLLGRTISNPIYATFGVIVGLLVWMNILSRLLIFAAAWAVTQPYSLVLAGPGERGSGRSTAIAASTEPVSVVAPQDFERVPAIAMAHKSGRRSRWRALALGAMAGAAAAALASRLRDGRGG